MVSPSSRFSVSVTGRTGIAAPFLAAARATALTNSGLTRGRAASWTRITGSAARAAPDSSAGISASATTPAATDSCLLAPPATTATTASGSQGAAAISETRAADVTITMRRTPAAAIASTDQRSTVRPSSSAVSLSRPSIRRLEPAATTTASAGSPGSSAVGSIPALTRGEPARIPSDPSLSGGRG